MNENLRINSVETLLAILERLAHRDGATVAELTEELDVTRSTVYKHLATLEQEGYVDRTDDEYHLGLRFFRFGGGARDRLDIYLAARSQVLDLARKTDLPAYIVVEVKRRGMYVFRTEPAFGNDVTVPPGTELALHACAPGKAILATKSEPFLEAYLDDPLTARTDATITDESRLREELREVSDRNLAVDVGEGFPGIASIASAVISENDQLLGALGVALPTDSLDDRNETTLGNQVRNAANLVSVEASYDRWLNEESS